MIWDVDGETVHIDDWDSALTAVSKLDRLEPDETRTRIRGTAAMRIVAEYGLKFYRSAHPGEETHLKLAIVIDENTVYVIPSECGESGVFIGEYWVGKYGKWAKKLTKDNIWAFSNIEAMLDGWAFFADMLRRGV